jgi:hypothetical protein
MCLGQKIMQLRLEKVRPRKVVNKLGQLLQYIFQIILEGVEGVV